ncbi:DUF3168 domain-containing protein [Andreprevotia chitinilytica]|uniref:DUF3168 domain-containing protein n=1 Tax=Andreprevotia chitinilytica TaxID=396808 RepID=UPI0005564C7E|nr:DUF3168 domain-containing protein [Andreprevotia chitinilytica]
MNRLTELVAMLQAVVGEHVYPEVAPEGTPTPYATWQVISEVPENRLAGGACAWTFRIQVNVWAERFAEARSFADALVNVLPVAWCVSMRSSDRDEETTLYRQVLVLMTLDV